MKDNWYDFERLSGNEYIYSKFPYRNPKNAYMWGFIHGMLFTTIILSTVVMVML